MSDKTRARNIIQRLIDLDVIVPNAMRNPPPEWLVNEVHIMIDDDYIPGGKRATSVTNIRPSPAGHRCGVKTGIDIQSGPFYCGEPATLIGDSEDKIVCVCIIHESILRQIAS